MRSLESSTWQAPFHLDPPDLPSHRRDCNLGSGAGETQTILAVRLDRDDEMLLSMYAGWSKQVSHQAS